jgi:hypothetical protein
MAALTDDEKTWLRQQIARLARRKGVAPHWTRGQVNDALDAINDVWDLPATQSKLSTDIEARVPGVFTNTHKLWLGVFWLILRGRREEEAL